MAVHAARYSSTRMESRLGAASGSCRPISRARWRRSPSRARTRSIAGATAERIVAAVREAGGRMTLDDMHSYRAVEREPLRGAFRGREILAMPPPSSGGVHVIQLLNILEAFPLQQMGSNSAAAIHVMAEAMKLAYADRAEHLGDPDFARVPVSGLVSKAYAAKLRSQISQDRARPSDDIRAGDPFAFESDQTTHYSIVDAQRQCRRQHIHAELFLWARPRRRRNGRSPEQRAR